MTPKPAAHVCGLQDRHNDPCTCTTQGTGPAHTPTLVDCKCGWTDEPHKHNTKTGQCFRIILTVKEILEMKQNNVLLKKANQELVNEREELLEALKGLVAYGNVFLHKVTERSPYDKAVEAIARAEGK